MFIQILTSNTDTPPTFNQAVHLYLPYLHIVVLHLPAQHLYTRISYCPEIQALIRLD